MPDNSGYMHAAYAVAATAYALYALSVWGRRRALRERLDLAGAGAAAGAEAGGGAAHGAERR